MKLKALKPHYFEGSYIIPPQIYTADKLHGEIVVKRGICQEIKTEKKERKPRRSKREKK